MPSISTSSFVPSVCNTGGVDGYLPPGFLVHTLDPAREERQRRERVEWLAQRELAQARASAAAQASERLNAAEYAAFRAMRHSHQVRARDTPPPP